MSDDEAMRRAREQVRKALEEGRDITVNPGGKVSETGKSGEHGIEIPEGKLAAFYWYERDPELLKGEKEVMNNFFPRFRLDKMPDGRLFWTGTLNPELRKNSSWTLHVVYDNNHPHNSSFGGSIKIYSVYPDLDAISKKLGTIPHTLRDSSGSIYLCTSRPEDFKAHSTVTSAASALGWAAKWIAYFELWIAGDISTERFASHNN